MTCSFFLPPLYKRDDLQLLPSSTTKRQVWEIYHQTASAIPDGKAVSYSLFCELWKQLTPQVVVTRPMTDLCWVCQQNSTLIMQAHNRPVEEKSEVCMNRHSCIIHAHLTCTLFMKHRHYIKLRSTCYSSHKNALFTIKRLMSAECRFRGILWRGECCSSTTS